MGSRSLSDSYLLPALDKREDEGGGVNWRCVRKLTNFVNTTFTVSGDLQYSLKSRLKCKDTQRVLNTLTVYHTLALNSASTVRRQLADKKMLQSFEKVYTSNKDAIVRRAILQLLVDWSFLFGDGVLGKRSANILRELVIKHGVTIRPSGLAAEVYEDLQADAPPPRFIKGFEFENRQDQIIAHKDSSAKKVSMTCASNLASGSLKFGSTRKLFVRCSARTIKSDPGSPTGQELAASESPSEIDELLQGIPRDCKNLQDLLSDIQVLMNRGRFDDVQSKMAVAEQLRNKCATSNNTLQDLITTNLTRVSRESYSMEREQIEPAVMKKLLLAGEALKSVLADFEQIHKSYIRHIDRMVLMTRKNGEPFCFNTESDSAKSCAADDTFARWVEFASPRTPLTTPTTRSASASGLPSARQLPLFPHSSVGKHAASTKTPLTSVPAGERGPPPLPAQSPFADAGALIEAAREKQVPRRSTTQNEQPVDKTPRKQSGTLSPLEELCKVLSPVQSSSRSFSEITATGRRNSCSRRIPVCPALKVRFTDQHLEDVLSRMSQMK